MNFAHGFLIIVAIGVIAIWGPYIAYGIYLWRKSKKETPK